ncbi:hypothetical protein HPB47_019311 [Ixodes persulcatus]|uniref:Uncharacterized protein n=1 Tax=Ixodes persulcatus TaxID=34615 RepID=A0AC60QJD0_IXOPE|nr:hypothetical protein HPB47_019311 [Ixodes persulcatus]
MATPLDSVTLILQNQKLVGALTPCIQMRDPLPRRAMPGLPPLHSKYAKQAQQAGEIFGTNDPKDSRRIFGNEFPGCLFEQVKRTYQREQFAIDNLPYVKPEEHSLANPQSFSFQYVPIGKVINNLLQVPELSKHLLQQTEQETTGPQILRCFCDGKAIKEVQTGIHNAPVHMLHILLYTDELGITNPLGAKQKRLFYFSELNLHPRYRSELKNIHLTLMAKYQDVEREGLDKLLQPLLHDLNELKNNGLQVQMQGSISTVKVAVVGVCGDNLSLNKLGRFSCCFSSGRVCRICMALKPKLPDLTREGLCALRSAATHKQHLTAISVNPALKKMSGQLMPDLMHDLFEGGLALVLHHVFQGLVSEGTLELADFKKVAAFKMLASNIPEGNAHWDLYLRFREIVDMVLATELLESYRHQTYVLDKPLSALGSRKVDPGTLHPCAQSLASKGQVWEAKSISTNTGDYRRDAILVMDKTTSLSFAQVTAVYIIDGDPLFHLEALQVEAFRRHKYSFKVHRTCDFYLRKPGQEVCSQRLDLYLDGELVRKWDLFLYS